MGNFIKIWMPFIFILGGCARIPKEDLEAKLNMYVPLKSRENMAKGEWPKENWWEMFHDENLNKYIIVALSNSPTLKSAASKVLQMQQIAKEKYASLLPMLGLNASTDYQHLPRDSIDRFPPSRVPAVLNQIELALNFSYELDFWGKNRRAYKAALSLAKAEIAEKALAQILLSISVSRAYFDLQYQSKKLCILEEILSRKKKLYELVQARYQDALDSKLSPLESQEDTLAIEEQIFETKNAIALRKHLLGILLGLGPDEEFHVSMESKEDDKAFLLPEDLPLGLIIRRADIMAQLWRVESAAYEIGVAKTLFYPNVNLFALAGFESLYWHTFFRAENALLSLKPLINLPLFTGGRLRANLRAKTAAYETAAFDYNERILRAAQEVADGVSSFQTVLLQKKAQEKILEEVDREYTLISERFRFGIDSLLSVLHIEEKVLTQKLEFIQFEYAKKLAAIALIKALGGGYEMQNTSLQEEYRHYDAS